MTQKGEMTMIEWAKHELDLLGGNDDEMQQLMNKNILEILDVFLNQGHSGFSASYVISTLTRLMDRKPLTPLTGNDDEWNEVTRGMKQNKRCSSVFMTEDGTAYDNDAIIVSDNGGITWFTSGRFRKTITFPYLPPTSPEEVYIEYTEEVPPGFTGDKYEIITDNPERIKSLYNRKKKEFDEVEWEN